eukprot:3913190-Rhodomonas_salina.1
MSNAHMKRNVQENHSQSHWTSGQRSMTACTRSPTISNSEPHAEQGQGLAFRRASRLGRAFRTSLEKEPRDQNGYSVES